MRGFNGVPNRSLRFSRRLAVNVEQLKLSARECCDLESIHSSHGLPKVLLFRRRCEKEGQGTILFLVEAPLLIGHTYIGSVVHELTRLRCLRDDHSKFNRKIVTLGKKPNLQIRIVKNGFRCIVIQANKRRDSRLRGSCETLASYR
jgi:hypothetical protein